MNSFIDLFCRLDTYIRGSAFFERGEVKSQRAEALSTLGLSSECTEQEIKSAYRQACLEYHPDRLGNLPAPIRRLAEEKLQKINTAYESLQSDGSCEELFVMATDREIKALAEITEREVVCCPLCETQNRLPVRKDHCTCRCGTCHSLLAVPIEFCPNNMNTFSGWFIGTCTNTTVSVTANLLLVIRGTNGGRVHGELGLSGELGGGGPFHGMFDSETIVFTTCSLASQTVIEWRAKLSADNLSGEYSVACDNPQMIADGFGRQEGIWSCSFVRSAGDLNPENREFVWIFDEGTTIGPIAKNEFVQHVASGCWPDKAIVAMEDRTMWTTVGEFLNTKTASEN